MLERLQKIIARAGIASRRHAEALITSGLVTVNGKTVTRRLNETEADLYQEWIANDRQLRALIQQMREVAAKATELKLKQAASP